MPGEAMRMARILDELRGGRDANDPERVAAAKVAAAWPKAAYALRQYDRFCASAADAAVTGGIGDVVFGGTGFPSPRGSLHASAARMSAEARFWYPGPSQVIADLRGKSLEGDDRASALRATVRDPEAVLWALMAAGGGAGRCQVQFGLAAGFMTPAEAAGAVAAYRRLLPSGSEAVIAVPCGPGGLCLAELGGAVPHALADAVAWCSDAGFTIAWSGDVQAFGRERLGEELPDLGGGFAAVIARKP